MNDDSVEFSFRSSPWRRSVQDHQSLNTILAPEEIWWHLGQLPIWPGATGQDQLHLLSNSSFSKKQENVIVILHSQHLTHCLLRCNHIPPMQAIQAHHRFTTSLLFALGKFSLVPNLTPLNIFLIKDKLHFWSDTSSQSLYTFRPNCRSYSLCAVYFRKGVLLLHPPPAALSIRIPVAEIELVHQPELSVHDDICSQPWARFSSHSWVTGMDCIWITRFFLAVCYHAA